MSKRKFDRETQLSGIKNNMMVSRMQCRDIASKAEKLAKNASWIETTIELFGDVLKDESSPLSKHFEIILGQVDDLMADLESHMKPVSMAHFQIFLRDKD